MRDFNYNVPTEIIFGREKENEIGGVLKRDNIKKVLFIYGTSSIKNSGLYDRVTDVLKASGIEFVEYGGIQSNPKLSDAIKAKDLGIEKGVEGVLAVGGGSVMDSAKAIAAAISLKCNPWDFYNGTEITDALPIYNIVTLAATASEMNSGFVITNEETKEKLGWGSPHCYPKVSILNPQLTCSVPANYTAFSAVDIIAHTIEGYLTSTYSTNLINRFKESIIKSVIETTEKILENPNDYDARAEFMWAATVALNGSTSLGMEGASSPNHMIEHGLSGVTNIPHGAGLSIIIPGWMKWYKEKNRDQFLRFSKEIFGCDDIESGISALEKWFESIGAPIRLSDYNIESDQFDEITDKAYTQATKWWMHEAYSKESISEILNLCK